MANPLRCRRADAANVSSTSSAKSKPASSSSRKVSRASSNKRRLVRQQGSISSSTAAGAAPTTRSRSRFNPASARNRLRTRNRSQSSTSTTTTARPSFTRNRFRPRTLSSSNSRDRNKFTSSGGRRPASQTSLFDYDYDLDYYDYDVELQSSQNSVPDAITVTHTVPVRTMIPVRENGRNTFRDILTTSPSLEVIAVTALKSTNIDGSPVIYANAFTNTPGLGTQVITFEALRATETTGIAFTPTRIRGLRTSFSHAVPSTIYNIRPVTTSIVQEIDQSQILSSLILKLLGQQQQQQQTPALQTANPAQLLGNVANPFANVPAAAPSVPATQFITHTSTYTTTLTNVESTVIPITLRGRLIKTTLVDTKTEVVTATEFSTETRIAPTQPALGAFGLPTARPINHNLHNLLPADLQQQLLLAQLQQQLAQQQQQQQFFNQQNQQQFLNQQILSQVNLDPEGAFNVEQTQVPDPEPALPRTSIVTVFVSGSKPGDFTKITSTVFLDDVKESSRKKRWAGLEPSAPLKSPPPQVTFTVSPVLQSSSDVISAELESSLFISIESSKDIKMQQQPTASLPAFSSSSSVLNVPRR